MKSNAIARAYLTWRALLIFGATRNNAELLYPFACKVYMLVAAIVNE